MSPSPLRRVFRNPFGRRALAREVDEELAFHLESRTRDLERAGMDPEAARREAAARFGDRRRWRASSLRERRLGRVTARPPESGRQIADDLWGAVLRMRRRPVFALVCVLVLTAGIGSSTAVIAIVDATMVRPLPFAEPDRVVRLYGTAQPRFDLLTMGPGNYFDIKRAASSYSALSTTLEVTPTVSLDGPRRIPALRVESEFFDVIGVEPALGRRILPEDESSRSDQVAVVTHDFWTQHLSGDMAALGSTLRVGNGSATVVGIMPEGFEFPLPTPPQIFLPFRGDRSLRAWTGSHAPVGRLRDGTPVDAADREAKAIARRLAEAYPETTREPGSGLVTSAVVQPFRDDFFWDPTARAFLLIVGGAVVLLLAAASLNASGLLIAHTLERRRELAVRAALGAGRWRLVRGIMAETGALTLVSLVAGLLVGHTLLDAVQATSPWVPLLDTARIDGRVLTAAAGLAVAVWILSGLGPALLGSRSDPGSILKEAGHRGGRPSHWTRRANIVTQFAVSCALMTGAGLAVQGYVRLTTVDQGFTHDHVAALHILLPRDRFSEPTDQRAREMTVPDGPVLRIRPEAYDVTRQVTQALRSVPGVTAAAAGTSQPFDEFAATGYFHEDVLDTSIPFRDKRQHRTNWVTPDYFHTLDIRLLEGRFLEDADDSGGPLVAVVNQALADTLRKGGIEPLGATLTLHHFLYSPQSEVRVVGVVANTTLRRSRDAPEQPEVYVPLAQQESIWEDGYWPWMLNSRTFVVRADGVDVAGILPDLQRAVWQAEPDVAFQYARTLEDMRKERFRFASFILLVLASFGAVSVLLVSTGTFALLAQAVRSRAHEIGIRRALGSSSTGVVMHFLRDGLRMAALGILLGVGGSVAIDSFLGSHLTASRWMAALAVEGWRVGPQTAVAVLLTVVALAASWGPAWAASRVDPLEAIRSE